MKNWILLTTLLLSTHLIAGEWVTQIKREDFGSAKNNSEYIRFEVFSTKVGIFTSRVPGYVLEANAVAEVGADEVKNMKLILNSKSLNTDGESRDEKLHGLCLEVEKYPEIEVSIKEGLALNSEQTMPAIIKVRGKEKPIQVKVKVEKKDTEMFATGEALLSVSQLEIPDPSIAVAKLDDKINIFFKLKLSSK